jgi:addiction module RelE/StbE family toxin
VVVWSEPAKADLHQIFEYIARDSRHYAQEVVRELMAKAEILHSLPRIGRVVPEINEETVRELPVHAYRILYEITGTDVVILTVVHKRRELRPEQIEK